MAIRTGKKSANESSRHGEMAQIMRLGVRYPVLKENSDPNSMAASSLVAAFSAYNFAVCRGV
jgi:hypothetical protein